MSSKTPQLWSNLQCEAGYFAPGNVNGVDENMIGAATNESPRYW